MPSPSSQYFRSERLPRKSRGTETLIDYSYSRKKNSSVLYPQGIVSNILVQPLMTTLFSNNQQLISPRFRHDNMHLKSLISDGNWNYIQYAVAKRLRRETSILVTVNLVIFTSI
jgi:hypothetical protein